MANIKNIKDEKVIEASVGSQRTPRGSLPDHIYAGFGGVLKRGER